MSSHHIIRDQQEPALFLCDIRNLNQEILHDLLQWAPTILGSGSGIEYIFQQGIKLDVALLSLDNAENFSDLLVAQMPVGIVQVVDDQEAVLKGLQYLGGTGHSAVNIFCKVTGREFLAMLEAEGKNLQITVLDGDFRFSIVRQARFRKWSNQKSIEIMALHPEVPFTVKEVFHQDKHTLGSLTIDLKGGQGFFTIESEAPFVVKESFRG